MLRVLVVAPFPPRLDGRHGGSRALARRLERLAEKHDVALLVLRAHCDPAVDDGLRSRCKLVEEVEVPAVGTSLAARLANRIRLRVALWRGTPTWAAERQAPRFAARLGNIARTWQPNVVQFEYRIMGQFLPALEGVAAARVLVDHDPAGSDEFGSRLLARLERRAWNRLGRSAARQVDAVVVFTDRDRLLVNMLAGSTPVIRIPLGYDLPPHALDPVGTTGRIVCVGSFIHPPNVDAATWFARSIFPTIRARAPEATLDLVGSSAPRGIRALGGKAVRVATDVPDVGPHLAEAAVVVAPIRRGGGMRVKVLEALAVGKAIVATPLALEGLDVRDGEQVVVAETACEIAAAVVELLHDRERRTSIARAAREWALANVDTDHGVGAYEVLYDSLLDGDRRQAVER